MTTSTRQGSEYILRLGIIAAVLAVLLPFVSACASSQENAEKTQLGAQVDTTLMQALQQVSMNSLDDVILPDDISLLKIAGPPVNRNETPTVLYMGADFCPYCAAIRWPLVLALMRFGEFSNLKYTRSSSEHAYPNTVTFSFHGTSYKSDYLTFAGVEFEDREGNRLEKPNNRQIAIYRTFDAKPYTRFPGAIPFLYLDGEYMQAGAPFSPGLLKGLSWKAVAEELKNQKSPLRHTVMGVTNLYTAAICKLTGGLPAQVCTAKAVVSAAARLPDSSL